MSIYYNKSIFVIIIIYLIYNQDIKTQFVYT